MRRVVPSDLYPLVLGFLRDNQLSEVANKFAKATGAVSAGFGPRPGVGRLAQSRGLDDTLRSQEDRSGVCQPKVRQAFLATDESLRPHRRLPPRLTGTLTAFT